MNKEIKRILKTRAAALEGSGRTMREIYEIMFSDESLVMCEKNDGFRTRRYTYGDIKRRVERAAASLFDLAGEDGYIALACDNNDYWIVGFFAILMSGNKPYLVNLRYPDTLTNGILKRLEIKYILTDASTSLDGESVVISELEKGEAVSDCSRFCDEFAFSSSATSMNEVICFYTGAQVSAQVLCFKSIVRKNPDIAATLGAMKSDGQILVGFALETDNELANATEKLERKNLDMIVLNSLRDKGAGFRTDTNKISICRRDGSCVAYELKPKKLVAVDIIDAVSSL